MSLTYRVVTLPVVVIVTLPDVVVLRAASFCLLPLAFFFVLHVTFGVAFWPALVVTAFLRMTAYRRGGLGWAEVRRT